MGRKRRVAENGTANDPRKWGSPAAKFLGELAECFGECGRDISHYTLAEAVVLRKEAPRRTQAQVDQNFENACEWAARTVFQMVEERCGADKARRIFTTLSRPRKSDEKWEKQKLLLRLIEGGFYTVGEAARDLASDAKALAEDPEAFVKVRAADPRTRDRGVCPMYEVFGMSRNQSVAVHKRRLFELKRRWKKEQKQAPLPASDQIAAAKEFVSGLMWGKRTDPAA
jgi:hypothetical protein